MCFVVNHNPAIKTDIRDIKTGGKSNIYPKIIKINLESSPNISIYIPKLIGKVKRINVRMTVIIYTSIDTILAKTCFPLLKIFLLGHIANLYPKKQESANGTRSNMMYYEVISAITIVYHHKK